MFKGKTIRCLAYILCLIEKGFRGFDISELHDVFAALPGVLLVAGIHNFGYICNEATRGRIWLTAKTVTRPKVDGEG